MKSGFSESTIQQYADGRSFERGYEYYQHDAVYSVEQRGNQLTAQVAGSGFEPYLIQISKKKFSFCKLAD